MMDTALMYGLIECRVVVAGSQLVAGVGCHDEAGGGCCSLSVNYSQSKAKTSKLRPTSTTALRQLLLLLCSTTGYYLLLLKYRYHSLNASIMTIRYDRESWCPQAFI